MNQYNDIPPKYLNVTTNDEGLNLVKYSRLAQYHYAWGNFPQLRQARGHVVTSSGEYVARPFDKFFNYQEAECEIDWSKPYKLYEKLDGFLLIVYYYNGRWRVNSSGSFDSIYSRWGESVIISPEFKELADKAKTYCFEGLHSDGQIVIKYQGDNRVVLLGARNNESGQHFLPEVLEISHLFELPHNYGSIDKTELLAMDVEGREGFIVYQDNKPVGKIKFDNYVRLHSYITNVSHRAIHAAWAENRLNEYLEDIPDEAYVFVHNYLDNILYPQLDQIKEEFIKILLEAKTQQEKPFGWWLSLHESPVSKVVYSSTRKGDTLQEVLKRLTYPEDVRMFANSPESLT
jgi:hypothetical protein